VSLTEGIQPMSSTVVELAAADWTRFRFAHSPLAETLQAIRRLHHPAAPGWHTPWLARFDPAAVLAELPLLAALYPPSGPVWVPDFLTPPPRHDGLISVEAELGRVSEYPIRLVERDIERSLASQPNQRRQAVLAPVLADPRRGRAELVRQLRHAWQLLIEPFWPAISRVIEGDIGYRTRLASRRGLGPMLGQLHTDLVVSADRIVLGIGFQEAVSPAGEGLLLVPSVFSGPGLILIYEAPWPLTLVYPARGVGNLWAAPERPPQALAELLGASRARLLLDLAEGRSTTAIALRHGLSPATTSAHLKRLTAAGLLRRERAGREVRYQRTSLADSLVAASE